MVNVEAVTLAVIGRRLGEIAMTQPPPPGDDPYRPPPQQEGNPYGPPPQQPPPYQPPPPSGPPPYQQPMPSWPPYGQQPYGQQPYGQQPTGPRHRKKAIAALILGAVAVVVAVPTYFVTGLLGLVIILAILGIVFGSIGIKNPPGAWGLGLAIVGLVGGITLGTLGFEDLVDNGKLEDAITDMDALDRIGNPDVTCPDDEKNEEGNVFSCELEDSDFRVRVKVTDNDSANLEVVPK